jgi:F0F1-type ATP synthase epsilon subunit
LTVDGPTKETYFVAGGYVDVADDQVTVLVDVVEKAGDIDRDRAEKAEPRSAGVRGRQAGGQPLTARRATDRA